MWFLVPIARSNRVTSLNASVVENGGKAIELWHSKAEHAMGPFGDLRLGEDMLWRRRCDGNQMGSIARHESPPTSIGGGAIVTIVTITACRPKPHLWPNHGAPDGWLRLPSHPQPDLYCLITAFSINDLST